MGSALRQAAVSIRMIVMFTVVLGIAYPLTVFVLGRTVPSSADGSLVRDNAGEIVGSSLIGQQFDGAEWFHARPSAGGYDALASRGSNLAADSPDLLADVERRRSGLVATDGPWAGAVPADAVTASGSGLDPHISPEYAIGQVGRVAAARGLPANEVADLVDGYVEGRVLGFLGEPRVNVLELNLALADERRP